MFVILLSFGMVMSIRACTGGTGGTPPKSKSVVYSYNVGPTLRWTYSLGNLYPGQAASAAAAQANAESDVKSAVEQAIPLIDTILISYQFVYEPKDAIIVLSCTGFGNGYYTVKAEGLLDRDCGSGGPATTQGTVSVQSPVLAIGPDLWALYAAQVQQILTDNNYATFY